MSNIEIFLHILSLISFYCGALDQHLTIFSSAFICEGGGHRFELDRVSIHVLPSDRALIDTVTFQYWGFTFFRFAMRALLQYVDFDIIENGYLL